MNNSFAPCSYNSHSRSPLSGTHSRNKRHDDFSLKDRRGKYKNLGNKKRQVNSSFYQTNNPSYYNHKDDRNNSHNRLSELI